MLAPKKKSRSMRERHAPDCHMKTSISPFSPVPFPYLLPTYLRLSVHHVSLQSDKQRLK